MKWGKYILYAMLLLAVNENINAQIKCFLKPRNCVKDEVDKQNRVMIKTWIKQQYVRWTTQKETEKTTLQRYVQTWNRMQQLRDYYKVDDDLFDSFKEMFLGDYASTLNYINRIRKVIRSDYISLAEREEYLGMVTNLLIVLIRANDKIVQAQSENETSGLFWQILGLTDNQLLLSADNPLFRGAGFMTKKNKKFEAFVNAFVAIMTVGKFEKTGNLMKNSDRVKLAEEAQDSKRKVISVMNTILNEILETIQFRMNLKKQITTKQLYAVE